MTDADILNFALNLEYLEAEFYTVVVTGKTLEESGFEVSGTGTDGPTTGGSKVTFTGTLRSQLAMTFNSIMVDEQEHVKYIRAALGSAAVAKPEINLDALGVGFANVDQLIAVSRALEQTGESAYAGAAQYHLQQSVLDRGRADPGHRSGTHRQPAPLLRSLWSEDNRPRLARCAAPAVGPEPVHQRSQRPGAHPDHSEVLAIVYGSSKSGTSRGGFFPKGVNGVIDVV